MAENILCVAAHPDDEILGCGGTLARHCADGDNVAVVFVADGVGARQYGTNDFDKENEIIEAKASRVAEAQAALACIDVTKSYFLDFPDNQLDSLPLLSIVQAIETIMTSFKPSVIYTHHTGDLNVDHQIAARATLTAARPLPSSTIKRILGFEVLSSTGWADPVGDAFLPNVYIDIGAWVEAKTCALQAYAGEMREYPHARSFEAVKALAQLRGAMVGREYAEAFTLLREIR